jgi:hypothetical protein
VGLERRNVVPRVAPGGEHQALARIAARQPGVVTREQLLKIGLSRHEITTFLRNAHLHQIHRGSTASATPPCRRALGSKRYSGRAVTARF